VKILATGPESSGTRYVTALLKDGGANVLHRSQPEGPDWIDVQAMLDDFDACVIVVRGRLAQIRSQQHRGITNTDEDADRKCRRALRSLAPILGDERVVLVTYESLAHPSERRHLLQTFALDPGAADRQIFFDENSKHYGEATWEPASSFPGDQMVEPENVRSIG
jgi:hypothetical protein